jgi:peptide/nickel transport system substrate-binding protein
MNINETLVRNNFDATAIEPALAESWNVSADGLTYRFRLRAGLKFSDGSSLKASDVKFSLERARDNRDSVFRDLYAPIKSIGAPDDRSVIITLHQPMAPLLATLALYAAAVLPEDAVKNHYDEWLEHPIGAGAFKFTEWKRGQSISLDRNSNYWEGPAKPKLDHVQWIYIPNDDSRILRLRTGRIDAVIAVPFDRIDELRQDPKFQIHLDNSSREDHLLINHSRPPLDRKDVRQALCMAIDLDAVVKTITFGHGTPANTYLPKGSLYYDATIPPCPYDPARAKAMLEAAGVKDLALELLISSADAAQERLAILLQSQLAQTGVTVRIEKQEAGQAWQNVVAGHYDLSIDYWTNDIIDPDEKSRFCLYGDPGNLSCYTRYRNTAVSTLIDAGRAEMDPVKRKAIYDEIQAIAKEDVHWIDLYYSPYCSASQTYVKRFAQSPLGRFTLEDTEIVK